MNEVINLGVVIDMKLDAGGALHMTQSHLFYLERLKKFNQKLNISLITTNKLLFLYLKKKYKFKIFLYRKDFFLFRLLNYLYKKTCTLFSLNSHFESFLKQKKINLVYFSSPSYLVLLFKNLSFIYTSLIWLSSL